MFFYERFGLALNCMWQLVVHENIHYLNQTWKIENKHTLSADIQFICTRFRKHGEKLAWDNLFIPVSSRVQLFFFISRQFVYIMFILQCPACKKIFNLLTKRQKHQTFWLNFQLVSTAWFVHHCPLLLTPHKTQCTRRLYTSSRRIK